MVGQREVPLHRQADKQTQTDIQKTKWFYKGFFDEILENGKGVSLYLNKCISDKVKIGKFC